MKLSIMNIIAGTKLPEYEQDIHKKKLAISSYFSVFGSQGRWKILWNFFDLARNKIGYVYAVILKNYLQ